MPVNKVNVQKVIDAIANEEYNFHMNWWMSDWDSLDDVEQASVLETVNKNSSSCGTIACIGGTAQIAILKERGITDFLHDVSPHADVYQHQIAEWLGMDEEAFEEMCYPPGRGYNTIKRPDAIRYLEAVRDGKPVNWLDIMGWSEEEAEEEDGDYE